MVGKSIKRVLWIDSADSTGITCRNPRGEQEERESDRGEFEVADADNQDNCAGDEELRVVRQIPAPDHAHVLYGIESVDVEHVAPPVLGAVDVVLARRHEHHVVGQISHHDVGDADHVQVGRGESGQTVAGQATEVKRCGCELINTLRQPIEVSLRIVSQVEKDDEKSADEEECVNAVHAVDDGLEHELMLDDLPELGVVGEVEADVACVPEDDPTH